MEEQIENSGEDYEAAAQQDTSQGIMQDQIDGANEHESSNEQGKQVPLSALQAEREERQRMQEEMKLIKDHLALMQANREDQQKAPKEDPMEAMSDDDVLTVGEAKKYLSQMNTSYNASIEEIKMMQKHPDYQEVIQKHLPSVLKSNPSLRKTLEKTQDYELAYYLAKNSPEYKGESHSKKKSQTAERILKNSEQPGSLSSMGSSTPVQMVKDYKKMSDKDFSRLVNHNMGFA